MVLTDHDRDLRVVVGRCMGDRSREANLSYSASNAQTRGRHELVPITGSDETLLRRITANPDIFVGGKPVIRGMRISVELILSLLAQGETPETILTDYPDLEPDDLRACLAYAHAVIAH